MTQSDHNGPEEESGPTLNQLYRYALRILGIKEYSTNKMINKLIAKGAETDQIAEIITLLKSDNLLSDDRYTEGKIKTLMNKGYSISFIQKKLKLENIDGSNEKINEVFDFYGITEEIQRENLRAKKFDISPDKLEPKQRHKLQNFLRSKGHYLDY